MRTTKSIAALAAIAVAFAACGDDAAPNPAAGAPATASVSDETTTSTAAPTITATTTETPVPAIDEAALQKVLDRWRKDVSAYGATLSVRVPGQGDVHLASGIDDRHPGTPMPTNGTFPAYSITKTFVAALGLQLVGEGRLALDDTVEEWLPELPAADETTLAMLLDHTAGLRDWDVDVVADLARKYTIEEALSGIAGMPPLGRPGERYQYTNAHFTAAAALIERELGMGLVKIVERQIARPLLLEETLVTDGSVRPTRHAWSSVDDLDPARPIDQVDVPGEAAATSGWGAGNIISSSEDLLTWGEALYSGELLGDDLTAELVAMRHPFELNASQEFVETDDLTALHYGLGTVGFCLDLAGCSPAEIEVVGHGGSGPGTRTLLAHHLESGTTIVLHANASPIELPDAAAILPDVFATLGVA